MIRKIMITLIISLCVFISLSTVGVCEVSTPPESVASKPIPDSNLRSTIYTCLIINTLVTVIGAAVIIGWFELGHDNFFPSRENNLSNTQSDPEPSSNDKDKEEVDNDTVILTNLREYTDKLQKLQDDIESDQMFRKNFAGQLSQDINEVKNNTTNVYSRLQYIEQELKNKDTMNSNSQAVNTTETYGLPDSLPLVMKQENFIQETMEYLKAQKEFQSYTNLFYLLGVLDKSSERLYPYLLCEISVILVAVFRKLGQNETDIANKLNEWANILNKKPTYEGFSIKVPSIGEPINNQTMVSAKEYNNGYVQKVNHWGIMKRNQRLITAEVE